MTLNEIAKKLIQNNKSRYLIFGISTFFAIAMTGTYGVLLFSPTITDVLMTEGSTYLIALGMYGITILGIVVFLLYANAVFIQFQMKETGIFLSLGMPPKSVSKMQNKQLDQVFILGGLAGIILSVPFSFIVYSLLTLFLSYTEHSFAVGWKGLGIAGGLWILLWISLRLKNALSLSTLDTIKILHSSSECEEVKGVHPFLGLIGIGAIPTGLVLFNITAVIDNLKHISVLFLVISLAGLYLLTAQITAWGNLIKHFCPKIYRKNILFYNLVRQKGNQYTLSLFVSSLLIALTIFSICFNGVSFLELYYQVKEDPYDYAILLGEKQQTLNKDKIYSIAEKNDIHITDWKSFDLVLLGREHQYTDSSKNEWGAEFAICESDFERLTGTKLSMSEDTFCYFEDSDDAVFQTFSEESGKFYNPTVCNDFTLKKSNLISKENIVNNSAPISMFLIFNDKTFKKINNSLDNIYKFKYYLFNGNNPQNSKLFQQKLLAEIIMLSDGKIFDSYQELAIKDKIEDYSDIFIPYYGNELYAARQWDFYPYSKQTQIDVQLEAGAIYLILIFFIAIISFVSASMIMGLKISGTILQDQDSYQRAMYLGLKEKELRKIIRKQIRLIYFFPTICGCITASFMINRFMAVSSVTHVLEITLVAVALSLIVFLIQYIVFFLLQKKLVVSTSKTIYKSI